MTQPNSRHRIVTALGLIILSPVVAAGIMFLFWTLGHFVDLPILDIVATPFDTLVQLIAIGVSVAGALRLPLIGSSRVWAALAAGFFAMYAYVLCSALAFDMLSWLSFFGRE